MLNNLFHGSVGFRIGVRASAGMNLGLLLLALLLMRTRLPPSPRRQGSTVKTLKIFLQEPAYASTITGIFLILAGLYFPIFFLQLKAIINGLTPGFAFYTLVILNGINTIGRVVPNIFVPRVGVFNVMIFCMTSLGILIFCMLLVRDIPGTVVFAILYGFFSGAWTPIAGALLSADFIWWRPLVFSGVCMLSGSGFLAFTRYVVSKKKGTRWV
ncbi:hypothetical protein H0H87_010412 [Tephrocybe sp. NHM501043]|nr:hypothetical protein H0H87_010412 [Tephrocybe sp. NHM501043]